MLQEEGHGEDGRDTSVACSNLRVKRMASCEFRENRRLTMFPSRFLPVMEYSVDACSTLAMRLPALAASPTMAAAKDLFAISNLLRAVSVFYATA
jgi:hypothetical protein